MQVISNRKRVLCETPLHLAIFFNHLGVVRALLEAGADLQARPPTLPACLLASQPVTVCLPPHQPASLPACLPD